jgi:hypothetical protein
MVQKFSTYGHVRTVNNISLSPVRLLRPRDSDDTGRYQSGTRTIWVPEDVQSLHLYHPSPTLAHQMVTPQGSTNVSLTFHVYT